MRQSGFKGEYAVLRRAQQRAQTGLATPAEYAELAEAYERLLRQADNIVRMSDATQKKLMRAQQILHRANQRYKEIAEKKSETLAIVSHDLKNKAGPIKELTSFVLLEVADTASPRAQELLRHIRDAAEKLSESVNETLHRESKRSSQITPILDWCDLSSLVLNIVGNIQGTAHAKQIAIRLELPDRCDACVDEFLIGEVFENLFNNAIKFSPPEKQIWIRLSRDADGVDLVVKDEGQGITPEDRARLFTRFTSLSAKPTGGEQSSGMGLFIVKRLVDLHRGTVTVESEGSGKGTTFQVRLPSAIRE